MRIPKKIGFLSWLASYRIYCFYCLCCCKSRGYFYDLQGWYIREGQLGPFSMPCDTCEKEINTQASNELPTLFPTSTYDRLVGRSEEGIMMEEPGFYARE